MAKRLQAFQCEVCGHTVIVFNDGSGTLTCCDQPMTPLVENTSDGAKEKHVPVIEKTSDGYAVKVGSVPHPMEAKHYIQWIELLTPNALYCRFLKPRDAPEAAFAVKGAAEGPVSAREYCNLHGYWKG